MNALSLILAIILGIAIAVGIWAFAERLWDEEGATFLRFIGIVLAIVIVTFGWLDAFGLAEEHYNVTLKFLDTGNVVCYEDARIIYGKNSQKTLVTSDGQRITIVNAEVKVEKVEE